MKKIIFFIATLIISILLFYLSFIERQKVEKVSYSNEQFSLILTGFGSRDFLGLWTGEISPLVNKLDESKDVSEKNRMCDYVIEGKLYGQDVLVGATGMAKVRTTACISEILNNYDGKIKEVILVGIAGISPSKGNFENEKVSADITRKTMLGDVCINSIAFDFDLLHYSADVVNSETLEPKFWQQGTEYSSQDILSDSKLANELFRASEKVTWDETPEDVKKINTSYHGINRQPKVWGLNECLEATSDLYWHDSTLDIKAKELAADLLSREKEVSINANEVLIVTSMEALPLGLVVNWWNEIKNSDIAFAYVRGASNFDQVNLNPDGTPSNDPKLNIESVKHTQSVKYAIKSASLPVLKMFEIRNEAN